ncbi:hypothetical protein Q5P01_004836 [Channa striata]|uniref:Rho-GAP domain-containing protein n=1 Tax=Channa striata TaxID=64152 RepID=A0AA88NF07_CHASR|nr:hypothetical protein Q5P01_004836 [Channa striata]
MDTPDYGITAMRRGSYDDAADSLRPHFRHLAHRRRSAPSLVFGRALGMPWSPISDIIVFAKLKSTASYRLKHRVRLEDVWLYGFEDELAEDEEGTAGEIDLRVTVVLAWALTFSLVYFCSPEVKERWLDTLHRKIKVAKERAGCASSRPDVLMKVLSGSIVTKTLTGGGMEHFTEFPLNGDAKISDPPKQLHNQENKSTQPIETKWNLVKRLRKGSSFISRAGRNETQLFGQPLCKVCPDDYTLPKPVSEMLVLLKKKGPSTEGVFRKPGNTKNMRDIREQLNSGSEVDLESQPVVLLVGLLKSFLKELPGSLLVSEHYDKWMTALDSEDSQQRALEIRKVVDELPGHNKLLLQHLLCVFCHILGNAGINKMDAHNLAVCIGPTLLQMDVTPLDEQKEKMQKVTDLTEFLIEHCEIVGENIQNLLDTDEDSSSQHHDSAYDSTDPEGDGEAGESINSIHGECGSSSSLSPSTTTSSLAPDATFNAMPPFNRRCSEPILVLPADIQSLCSHARSSDDCSVERGDFREQPLTKQISDDSFLLKGRGGARPGLWFPKQGSSSNLDPLPYMDTNRSKDCSCSSLESAASNQSEGSVFTSSPVGSPGCSRRANTTSQPSGAAKAQPDIPRPLFEEKRRSQSMRAATKVLMRTRSLATFSRSSLKKDTQKENSFPCETLQEDSQSETDPPAELPHRPRPLSAIEVFKHVDSRLPCKPPTYEQAVQNVGLPPKNRPMTVQDAINRKSRPSSVNYDFASTSSPNQYIDFSQMTQDKANAVEWRQPFRQRAMSEVCVRGSSRSCVTEMQPACV